MVLDYFKFYKLPVTPYKHKLPLDCSKCWHWRSAHEIYCFHACIMSTIVRVYETEDFILPSYFYFVLVLKKNLFFNHHSLLEKKNWSGFPELLDRFSFLSANLTANKVKLQLNWLDCWVAVLGLMLWYPHCLSKPNVLWYKIIFYCIPLKYLLCMEGLNLVGTSIMSDKLCQCIPLALDKRTEWNQW